MSKCLSEEMIIIDPGTFWGLAGSCGGDKELSVEVVSTCLNVYFLIFLLRNKRKCQNQVLVNQDTAGWR